MQLKELAKQEAIIIYENYCPLYFPKNELKPVNTVEWLFQKGIYRAFGLYRCETLVGFAFLIQVPQQDSVLLDYFATIKEYRSLGIGGQFLSLLSNVFSDLAGIFIESEDPYYAIDDEDRSVREKRIHFYKKCHAMTAPLLSNVFDVHYQILFLSSQNESLSELTADDFYRLLDTIYQNMFPEKHYLNHVSLDIIQK